jgi:ABC-type transport system involved in multi-copper enzyme maturation permease subunit
MSTSKAIKPKRDETLLTNWESMPERAPSIERDDQPIVARVLAMIGLFFLVLGCLAMAASFWWQRVTIISPDWGYRIASIGLVLIFYHMFVEHDFQFRRLYGFLGIVLMLTGVVMRLLAFRQASSNWFILFGVPSLFVGVIPAIAVIRNETEASFRNLLLNLVGCLGALMIAFAIFRGAWIDSSRPVAEFLPVEGVILLVLGLIYVCSFIGLQEVTSERGYFAGLALGAAGILGFAIGLILSIATNAFFVPAGLILMGMSIIYVIVAIGICVDWPVVVLARRELAAYFLSPVAYLVFGGQLIFGWIMFTFFINSIIESSRPMSRPMFEPIIINYVLSIIPVFVHMFFVPAITMRLLSEERRSGTLEVLLTAPVNEISIVAGKFVAAWIFYMLLWMPWWIFLISLRYYGGDPFDYRPILSFMVSVSVISAGFIAMGMFCSSLTSNQIVAAVFTFVGMMAHLAIYFAGGMIQSPGSVLADVIQYVNFVDLWIESLRGTIVPRYLMFHASLAFFFLFITVKVLDSRKWK